MDDQRFRTLLRSVLALSLATPAVIVACGQDALDPFVSDVPDASASKPTADAALAPAPPPALAPVPITDAGTDALDGLAPPPLPRTGQCAIPDDVAALDADLSSCTTAPDNVPDAAPDASYGCGHASLDAGAYVVDTCTVLQQFPCCVDPRMPRPIEPTAYPLAACRQFCEDTPEKPLHGCTGYPEQGNGGLIAQGSSPVLRCEYYPRDPTKTLGCFESQGVFFTQWARPVPCNAISLVDASTSFWPSPAEDLDPAVCRSACLQADGGVPEGIPSYVLRDGGVRCQLAADGRGSRFVRCGETPPVAGRRPAGLRDSNAAYGTPAGAWFAEAARMEAASVHAFAVLRAELLAHHAPKELVERAERAEADEVKHARITARLARRLGALEGAWSAPVVDAVPVRALEAIAIENAVEGCVNETYAAILAHWQAAHAKDGGVRVVMTVIAEDETRHSALAWSVAAWARTKLDAAANARVDQAISHAFACLERASVPDPVLVGEGLLPSAAVAGRLVATLALLRQELS